MSIAAATSANPYAAFAARNAAPRRVVLAAGSAASAPAGDVFTRSRAAAASSSVYQAVRQARASAATTAAAPALYVPSTPRPDADVDTRAGRDAMGDYYHAVLDELRQKYDEPEAMRRYDAFMRSEGFVPVSEAEDAPILNYNPIDSISCVDNSLTGLNGFAPITMTCNDVPSLENYPTDYTSPYHLYSKLHGRVIDGETKLLAESWAAFSASRSIHPDARAAWLARDDGLTAPDGFDMEAVLAASAYPDRTIAVGTDADLAARLRRTLEQAGVTLEPGETLALDLHIDPDGERDTYVTGVRDDIADAVNADRGLIAAMQAAYTSAPAGETASLPGQYDDGDRANVYRSHRQFIYNADHPDAVVMADTLGVYASGYNYTKKVGDEYNPQADSHRVGNGVFVHETFLDPERAYDYGARADAAVTRAYEEAVASGGKVAATATKAEEEAYNERVKEQLLREKPECRDDFKWYQATPEDEWDGGEAAAAAATEPEPEVVVDDTPVAYVDDKGEVKNETFRSLYDAYKSRAATNGMRQVERLMKALFAARQG